LVEDRREVGWTDRARQLAGYDDAVRAALAGDAERPLEGLLEFLARDAADALRADRATIFLLNPATDELWARLALGVEDRVIRFPAARGIAGHVVATGAILNIPDAYADPRFNPAIDRETGYRTRSILCAPLRGRDGRVIGALQVLNKLEGGPFTAEDEQRTATRAADCAVVIENVLLYEQLRTEEASGARRAGAAPTVLLADDDPTLEALVAEVLGEEFRVRQVLDGDGALQTAAAERPDVVLLDVRMPGRDGIETCRALRAAPAGREVPIIMLTASQRPEDLIRAFEAGANDYLTKPFAPAQLRAKTQTWLLRTARLPARRAATGEHGSLS
jgi:CheY-like chemotaxis protein